MEGGKTIKYWIIRLTQNNQLQGLVDHNSYDPSSPG